MMKYNRDEVLKDLKHNVCEIHFTKLNGDQRVMKCTLWPGYLPQTVDYNHLGEMHVKPENKNTVVAWDVQANGWRSFRIDNVSYVETIENF